MSLQTLFFVKFTFKTPLHFPLTCLQILFVTPTFNIFLQTLFVTLSFNIPLKTLIFCLLNLPLTWLYIIYFCLWHLPLPCLYKFFVWLLHFVTCLCNHFSMFITPTFNMALRTLFVTLTFKLPLQTLFVTCIYKIWFFVCYTCSFFLNLI